MWELQSHAVATTKYPENQGPVSGHSCEVRKSIFRTFTRMPTAMVLSEYGSGMFSYTICRDTLEACSRLQRWHVGAISTVRIHLVNDEDILFRCAFECCRGVPALPGAPCSDAGASCERHMFKQGWLVQKGSWRPSAIMCGGTCLSLCVHVTRTKAKGQVPAHVTTHTGSRNS